MTDDSLSLFTEMCTALEGVGLEVVVEGPKSRVYACTTWAQEQEPLTPTQELEGAVAAVTRLGKEGLELICRTSMVTFPMKETGGLFEVRRGGVRFYGARLTKEPREICVLLGAEHKKGKSAADKKMLARCAVDAETFRKVIEGLRSQRRGKR